MPISASCGNRLRKGTYQGQKLEAWGSGLTQLS